MENVRTNTLSLFLDTNSLFDESSSLTDKDHIKSLLILLYFSRHVLRDFCLQLALNTIYYLKHHENSFLLIPKCNCLSDVKQMHMYLFNALCGSKLDPKVRKALWGRIPKYIGFGPQNAV
jgi:hypothetical protein